MATYPASGVLKSALGTKAPRVIEQIFDLSKDAGVTAALGSADVVNLFSVTGLVLGGELEVVTAAVGPSACTATLACGSTSLSGALSLLIAGGVSTVAGATVASSAQTVKITLGTLTGTIASAAGNPTIKVKLLVVD